MIAKSVPLYVSAPNAIGRVMAGFAGSAKPSTVAAMMSIICRSPTRHALESVVTRVNDPSYPSRASNTQMDKVSG